MESRDYGPFTKQEFYSISFIAASINCDNDPRASLKFWRECEDRKRKWITAEHELELRQQGRHPELESYEWTIANGMRPYEYLCKKYGEPQVPWQFRKPDHLAHL
jgi:hypothetical protein